MIELKETEHIVCCYGEYCAGPGWSNAPLWYIIRDAVDGSLRQECIQPEERSPEMNLLFPVLTAAHGAMMKALGEDTCREWPPCENCGSKAVSQVGLSYFCQRCQDLALQDKIKWRD
jgi:hypothetical protein